MLTRRAVALGILFLIVGTLAGGAAGWYASRYFVGQELRGIQSYRAAVEGKLQARMLARLREGKYEETIAILEPLIDSNLASVAGLDDGILPDGKVEVTHAAINEIRQYREKYPRASMASDQKESPDKARSLRQR